MTAFVTWTGPAPASIWCGQSQPHDAHMWVTRENTYAQCGGCR